MRNRSLTSNVRVIIHCKLWDAQYLLEQDNESMAVGGRFNTYSAKPNSEQWVLIARIMTHKQ